MTLKLKSLRGWSALWSALWTLPLVAQVPIPPAQLAKLPRPEATGGLQNGGLSAVQGGLFQVPRPRKAKGKYRMDIREGAFKVTDDHGPAIQAGDSTKSAIILMAAGLIDEMLMPPPEANP